MKRKHSKIILIALICVMALTGCSPSKSNGGSSSDKTDSNGEKVLTVGTTYTVSTFIPWKSTTDGDRYILSNVYESLIEYDTMGNFIPGLAESWENDNNLTWTFHLRDNSYWQTGNDLFKDEKVKVTANDVKAVFEWTMDEKNEAIRCSSIKNVIERIEVVDEKTIKFITKQPEALLLSPLSNIYIFPLKAVEQKFDLGKTPVGSGAYKFVKYNTDDQICLLYTSDAADE